jgi:hypothetical protein
MTDKDLAIGEFSIMELEDRLEFAELCDDNCGCGTTVIVFPGTEREPEPEPTERFAEPQAY